MSAGAAPCSAALTSDWPTSLRRRSTASITYASRATGRPMNSASWIRPVQMKKAAAMRKRSVRKMDGITAPTDPLPSPPVRRLRAVCAEHIPRADDRVDQRRIELLVDLTPQHRHVHVDHVAAGVEVHVPHVLADLRAGQDPVHVPHE